MIPAPQGADLQPARTDPVRAGLLCRCPACGRGRLFQGFLTVRDRCDACGLDLRRLETGDGPATFIMQVSGFVVVFAALYVEIAHAPPMWLHLAVWPVLVALLALGLMRPGKGLMMGLEHRRRREGRP